MVRALVALTCVLLPRLTAAAGNEIETPIADRSFVQQLQLSVAAPSGITAAVAYTPTFSFFDHRLNAGLGGRVSSFFGSGSVNFPKKASPSHLNLLLFGRHDYGQLDSEFFAGYWSGSWGVRAGVSHMSTEYTTSRPLDGNNDRFRASATRGFVALGYRF